MDIQHLIIFCGAQVIGLQLILFRKKFRTVPNQMLMLILFNIVTHYIYYYLFYTDKIQYNSNGTFLIIPFATLAPVVVYYYVVSVIYGKLQFTRRSAWHLTPIFINAVIFIFFITSNQHKQGLLYLAKSVTISLYIIYPFIMVKMLSDFYNYKGFMLNVFKYNKKKTVLIRLLIFMMTVHFCILVAKYTVPLFIEGSEKTMDIINLCFLMFLGYAISYVIISEPKTIQHSQDKIGLGGFKKYDKSKLTRSEAENNVRILNKIMEDNQPYLNPDFNLTELSSLSKISTHKISETLNGLIGQSFNDYVNNYRVEEFKKLTIKEEFKHFTILALAFEAGFKSKATFNAAFKKFTGETPTQYTKKR
ncbi:AraC family transcriptional regulator [Labilibacter sediminis]|nr:AraC family transcriptional regulator [Labilibacter sediminis]